VSALGSALRFETEGEAERRLALDGNAFVDLTAGPLNLRAEGYVVRTSRGWGR
jgi:hypothetical protein